MFGVEADAVWARLGDGGAASLSRFTGTAMQTVMLTSSAEIDWMASMRAKLGFATGPALIYVTGGGAFTSIDATTTATVVFPSGAILPTGTFTSASGNSTTRFGWTIGGGLEWAFGPNWSLAAEYRHTHFGSVGTTVSIPDGLGGTFATGTGSVRLAVDQVTARLNYRFGPTR